MVRQGYVPKAVYAPAESSFDRLNRETQPSDCCANVPHPYNRHPPWKLRPDGSISCPLAARIQPFRIGEPSPAHSESVRSLPTPPQRDAPSAESGAHRHISRIGFELPGGSRRACAGGTEQLLQTFTFICQFGLLGADLHLFQSGQLPLIWCPVRIPPELHSG